MSTMNNVTPKVSSDNRVARLLGVVVALQALTLAGQWLGNDGPRMLPAADAQLANPGADRQQLIDSLKETNAKLDRIAGILESGQLQVRVVNSDEQKGANPKDGKDAGRAK
jgi:hypothetical protein